LFSAENDRSPTLSAMYGDIVLSILSRRPIQLPPLGRNDFGPGGRRGTIPYHTIPYLFVTVLFVSDSRRRRRLLRLRGAPARASRRIGGWAHARAATVDALAAGSWVPPLRLGTLYCTPAAAPTLTVRPSRDPLTDRDRSTAVGYAPSLLQYRVL
jgi:hypothetical protein